MWGAEVQFHAFLNSALESAASFTLGSLYHQGTEPLVPAAEEVQQLSRAGPDAVGSTPDSSAYSRY
jgi:hypothetical protein